MSRSTQTNVENGLTELFSRETDLGEALNNEAQAEHDFKLKRAEEFLKADGTVDAREAKALIACKEQHLAYLKKKATKEFTHAKWKDALANVSARQSILSAEVKGDFSYATNKDTV